MKRKIVEWIKRYLPSEIASTTSALTGGLIAHYLFHNPLATALIATWSENIGFYGVVFVNDYRAVAKERGSVSMKDVVRILRNMALEFGSAESVDSFIIRPGAMYFFPIFLNNVPLGLFIGKFVADIMFYIPAIISYELRKKYLQ